MDPQSGKTYIASISYGKDSLAMLHVITDVLHWPLDRIVTADVWATDTIPGDLPPMVEFKDKADRIIKERWGIEVEHLKKGNYEAEFYKVITRTRTHNNGRIYGWPFNSAPWCQKALKTGIINRMMKTGCVQYLGIACDEPNRFHNASDVKLLPLVEAGWTELMCREWCEDNDLLSPIYSNTVRGGCWFCHNQSVNQLRDLYHQYPDLWALLLKWDNDSPVTFKPNGHTVHDFERRFKWEDAGFKPVGKEFRWSDINEPQMNIFQFIKEGEVYG